MLRLSVILVTFLAALYVPAQTSLKAINIAVPPDSNVLQIPAEVLSEEIARRTGITWAVGTEPGARGAVIFQLDPGLDREAFRIATDNSAEPRITVTSAGRRGAMFAVGYLLRTLDWSKNQVALPGPINTEQAPEYPIRGHQLGFRAHSNSYDGWDEAIYDQYIRDLTFFGTNAVENIPFQDDRQSPVMRMTREQANRTVSAICDKYDVDYWVWTPADFDLLDAEKRAAALKFHEAFYQECPRLDGIFFPGGDPGHNHPREVMPFLQDLSTILPKYHPNAKIWMSLQGFDEEMAAYFFNWLDEHQPEWFGGMVAGPGSPPLPDLRARLNPRYPIRDYPDITHVVRCQYPELNLDQVFALTAGREPINPRPLFYKQVFSATAPHTAGFISYSDGSNDDVNKALWSSLGWDSTRDPRAILVEYARCFFAPESAERIADGILALEQNWQGALRDNDGVPETLKRWQSLEKEHKELGDDWRWQMLVLRAHYDAYQRERLARETALEQEALALLAPEAGKRPTVAMAAALAVLNRAVTDPVRPDLRNRLLELFDALYQNIRLQTDVEQYHAVHPQRGCMLEFLDYPLNNRFWLEDEFHQVLTLPNLQERQARLEVIRTWENPGPGSFYDDIGNLAESPRATRHPDRLGDSGSYWWWDNGMSRTRLSWQVTGSPGSLEYTGLDPQAHYLLRFSGFGDLKPRADDQPLEATLYDTEAHTLKEFPVPPELVADGALRVTFDDVRLEGVNWRQQPRLSEAWLIKLP
ncbi:MAG: hypothetical protein KF886_01345 [Candidatus Hydrogenedentes bacterium]|nr:hypothetical protein [Candidatus Hydrogenedentota bacterium]